MTRRTSQTFATLLAAVMMASLWLPTLAPQSDAAVSVVAVPA